MANDQFPLSRDARVYYNTDLILVGSASAPTLKEWLSLVTTVPTTSMRNLTLNLDDEMADTNTRESTRGGFNSEKPILHNGEVTFDTPWDLNDGFINQMSVAWSLFAPIGLAALNRAYKDSPQGDVAPVSGDIVNGFGGNFFCRQNKDEEITDIQRGNWTMTHSDNGIWYVETIS